MEQVVVDAVRVEFSQLGSQVTIHVLAALDHPGGQLGGHLDSLAVAFPQGLAHQRFALARMVRPGRVEVVDALIDGVTDLVDSTAFIDLPILGGQRMHPKPRIDSSSPFFGILLYCKASLPCELRGSNIDCRIIDFIADHRSVPDVFACGTGVVSQANGDLWVARSEPLAKGVWLPTRPSRARHVNSANSEALLSAGKPKTWPAASICRSAALQ